VSQAPSFRQERRKYRRSIVGMPIQALRRTISEDNPGRIVGLHVADVSRGGVGAVSQEMLESREPLLLLFPPVGPGRGLDTPGQVVRCDRCADHYAVGIAFDRPWPDRDEIGAQAMWNAGRGGETAVAND
jgi:hypothetical protein